jgi:hypothetical protein
MYTTLEDGQTLSGLRNIKVTNNLSEKSQKHKFNKDEASTHTTDYSITLQIDITHLHDFRCFDWKLWHWKECRALDLKCKQENFAMKDWIG